MSRKITIEPVTRIEGHGKVTIKLDNKGNVDAANLHVTQVRGFEKFCEGRLFWEMPIITQRICGICPVSHHLASSKAGDAIMGVQLTETAKKLRKLIHMAQLVQSHALHFFYLASPELVFGFDADPAIRNVVGVISKIPDVAVKGVKIRAFGQRIIEAMGDKRVHPTASIPGGMTRAFSKAHRDEFLKEIDEVIANCELAMTIVKDYCAKNPEIIQKFASFPSGYLGLIDDKGNIEYYDGKLRMKDKNGNIVEDRLEPQNYLSIISEKVEDWSYLKFPYYSKMGYPEGMYRVGPLGRINVADSCSTPLANKEMVEFKQIVNNGVAEGSMFYHYARLIEMLNCAEEIKILLTDEHITDTDFFTGSQTINPEGVGVIEAPRGTLIHHYWVDPSGKLEKVNLIVSTGHNNLAMNASVLQVAREYIKDGNVTEGILNHIEVAIRCYDPCLSCSSHALGHMPLEITIKEADGTVREVIRN
jgi:NAD-reducing hydrogenase large subunit